MFDLAPNVLGFLEWASGVLRINGTEEDLSILRRYMAHRRLMDGTEPDDHRVARLVRTITHEQFHFLQVITTGYAYSLACVVFWSIWQHLGKIVGTGATPKQYMALLDQELPREPKLAGKFAEIDQPGPDGLTIRDVIESSAHLYECKSHLPNLDHQMYCRYLADADVPGEYRRAYDLASEVLGAAAFQNFLVAAAIALCFRWPNEVFPGALDLMRSLAHLDAVYRKPEDLEGLLGIAPELRRHHQYFGTAEALAKGEWLGKRPLTHPFYTPALNAALRVTPTLVLLIVDPLAMRDGVNRVVVQPVLLNHNRIQVPAGFETREIQKLIPVGPEELVNVWITIAAFCQRVIAGTGHQMHYRVYT